MRRLGAFLLAALVVCALAGAAAAHTIIGVTEDAGKYSDDGGDAFYSALNDSGLTENVIAVRWDPTNPSYIEFEPRLQAAIATAQAHHIKVVLTVYPAKARAIADYGDAGFVGFLVHVARTF